MKLKFIALFLVAALAIGIVLFYQPTREAVGLVSYPTLSKGLVELYDPLSIQYADPIANFSLRYPKGYVAESEDGVYFAFSAPTPSGYGESFVVSAVNATSTPSSLSSLLFFEYPTIQKVSETTVLVNEKKTPRLQYSMPGEGGNEDLHVVQSLVPCANGSLYYVAVIPDSVKEDLTLADYVMYSIVC